MTYNKPNLKKEEPTDKKQKPKTQEQKFQDALKAAGVSSEPIIQGKKKENKTVTYK